MIDISTLASDILIEPFEIPKNDEQQKLIENISQEIFDDEKTRKDRTLKQVFSSTEAIALEAWVANTTTFDMNSLEFDYKNPDSYAYDLIEKDTRQTIEVKTCIRYDHKYWNINNWSYVSTMMKNITLIDFVYAAEFTRQENEYIVSPKLLLSSNQLDKRIYKSKFNNGYYFNHLPIKNDILYRGPLA